MKNLDIETVLWIERLQVELERAKRQLESNTELMDAAKAEIERLRGEVFRLQDALARVGAIAEIEGP